MIKLVVLLVFAYNLITTISNPTVQGWVAMVVIGLIALGLFVKVSKKIVGTVIKIVAVLAVIGYAVMQFIM